MALVTPRERWAYSPTPQKGLGLEVGAVSTYFEPQLVGDCVTTQENEKLTR
jgi:hypothetical protein